MPCACMRRTTVAHSAHAGLTAALARCPALTPCAQSAGAAPDAIHVMHTEVEHVAACLEVVRARWDGIVGVYAHSSTWDGPEKGAGQGRWVFDGVISPADYADAVDGWVEHYGVQLVGGCCGTGVHHIEMLHGVHSPTRRMTRATPS